MKKILSLILSLAMILFSGVKVYSLELPQSDTNVHFYMDWNMITNESSNQWQLQHSGLISTDENGIRYAQDTNGEKYYLVALAERYGTEIGSVYEVTLDNGSVFRVMLGDCKSNEDAPNGYGRQCYNFITQQTAINVLEFIVEEEKLPEKVTQWGSLTAVDTFNGNLEEIEYLGRAWYPAD